VYGVLKEKTTVQETIVQDVRDLLTQAKANIALQGEKNSNKRMQVQ
jgi:hypothetical protein